MLGFLKENGFESVSIEDILTEDSLLPERPVVLTFDDSYESIIRYAAPLMTEFGYTGTLYVITDFVGKHNEWDVNLGWKTFKHLSWPQIIELKKIGFEVGSHTVHHADLTRLPKCDVVKELTRSKKTLEDRLGDPVLSVSLPFGRYDAYTFYACEETGYRACCGYWIPDSIVNRFQKILLLRRQGVYIFDRRWNLRAKCFPQRMTTFEILKLRVINFFSHGSSIVKPARWSD